MVTDRMYFLVKDPHWTFLWWELSAETIARLIAETGLAPSQLRFFLRIHDVTLLIFDGSNSHWHFDLEVRGFTDHWYLSVPRADRVYCAEGGFKTPDGRFIAVVRSNAAVVPRDAPAEPGEVRWSTISI